MFTPKYDNYDINVATDFVRGNYVFTTTLFTSLTNLQNGSYAILKH